METATMGKVVVEAQIQSLQDAFDAVRLVVQGRDCVAEVAEVPDGCPALIGQLPLEALDFVVDPAGQRLIVNPDDGGERMIDMF